MWQDPPLHPCLNTGKSLKSPPRLPSEPPLLGSQRRVGGGRLFNMRSSCVTKQHHSYGGSESKCIIQFMNRTLCMNAKQPQLSRELPVLATAGDGCLLGQTSQATATSLRPIKLPAAACSAKVNPHGKRRADLLDMRPRPVWRMCPVGPGNLDGPGAHVDLSSHALP